jgi:hypothetical protein
MQEIGINNYYPSIYSKKSFTNPEGFFILPIRPDPAL